MIQSKENVLGKTNRHIRKHVSEYANTIKRNNINSSTKAAHYTGFHSYVKIEYRTFSVN